MSLFNLTSSIDDGNVDAESQPTVDIVAVHGIGDDAQATWTHSQTGTLWLRDLLPQKNLHARVLAFRYSAAAASRHGGGSANRINSHAITLITALAANRQDASAFRRPLIFVCHGLGGILVKTALRFSESGSIKDENRRSIYVSTSGILFFGTPHTGLRMQSFSQRLFSGQSQILQSVTYGSEILQEITDHFSTMLDRFAIWCFWEAERTRTRFRGHYIVEQDCATIKGEQVNQSGLPGTHSQICKFSTITDSGFTTVCSALCPIFKTAPSLIKGRWRDEKRAQRDQLRAEARAIREAQELLQSESMPPSPVTPTLNLDKFCGVCHTPLGTLAGKQKSSAESTH